MRGAQRHRREVLLKYLFRFEKSLELCEQIAAVLVLVNEGR
jgi:hypothetical protein